MTALALASHWPFAAALGYGAVVAWRGAAALSRTRLEPERRTLPAGYPTPEAWVTLVQPILGGDPRLERVLAETLAGTPTWARFLWLVDDDDALGQEASRRLVASDPRVRVLRCTPPAPDENPKVKKLVEAVAHVATPYVAVLDDDTVIGEANLVAALDVLGALGKPARADLYTGLPSYDVAGPLASRVMAQFVNDGAPFTYLPLQRVFGALSLNGMFYVAATGALRETRAFEAIRGAVCDDYALARLLRGRGWRIHQGWTAMRLSTSVPSLRAYVRQMHRWFVFALVLVRDQPVARRAALVALLGVPPLLLAIVLACAPRGKVEVVTAVLVLGWRQLVARRVARRVLGTRPGGPPAPAPLASVLAELAQPLHALHAMAVSTVRWRKRRVRVLPGGVYREVDAPSHPGRTAP